MNNTRRFIDTFRGRDDYYGAAGPSPYCVKQPLTETVWWTHLEGLAPIGVYPRRDDDLVHWGCSDFDTEDHLAEGKAVQQALRVMGIPSFPERSRSGKTHLWVFLPAGTWVPAADMRRTLLLAHWVAEVPAKEINPKSEGGSMGNFVRLPYSGTTGHVMLGPSHWLPLDLEDFLATAHHWVARAHQLEVHAGIWTSAHPETSAPTVPVEPYDGQLDHLMHLLPCGASVLLFRDGPLDEDRSEGLWRLANDCRRGGLPAGDAIALVADADVRWGKHGGDHEKLWRYYVKRAYGG